MSSHAIYQAVWPANTHGSEPSHARGSRVVNTTGSRKIVVAPGACYQPPDGWTIDSVLTHESGKTEVVVSRE